MSTAMELVRPPTSYFRATTPAAGIGHEVLHLVEDAPWQESGWLTGVHYHDPGVHKDSALSSMLKALDKMADCMEEGWDGEGAKAVQPETLEIAREVAGLLASYLGEVPGIRANSRGEIEFSWNVDGRMLLLGVCPGRVIAFAAIHGESRVRGREPWGGSLPVVVPCLLKSLFA